ncbi:23S rRNA (adenine(2503)-C(2))-methyltransferase RlmN [Helicobacter monodelphidis]|uniref:23S rRNA (adenine(2503)-C(2))-methyltransferase RlmN n=1 Tax=Helicobacter sp. 15-1451 TaxID=2004995 RepID=UPI000DCB760A|nr:23S rRNA (adenine(2503)-C(2))-methyltransferase RlmN [Helicobacter sp. 15-1451]RAX58045.1 23S rRNA (adenine(2503)-C(2))-methyltransferase RlmN [Helicobacter sp. 15-1451]
MQNIYDLTLQELEQFCTPSYRAKQIYSWLYHHYIDDFDAMNNLSKDFRQTLKTTFQLQRPKIITTQHSKDGSKKYLFQTHDLHNFESVLLKMRESQNDETGKIIQEERWTLCVSSQIGCKVGCAFCLTAKSGFVRNLSAGEIVSQVVSVKKANQIPPQKRLNIVFMGMGEPLDNFDEVIKAIQILANKDGLSISPKRQTISTSGIAPKIKKLGELNLGVQLALSLHAVTDELRSKLIPMNKAYNIQEVISTLKKFPINSRKRLMFEYLMIAGVNDDIKSAQSLLKLLNGFKAKVNLILFNPYENSQFQRPSEKNVRSFQEFLMQKGLLCTIRESKGLDISAACGQLREQNL